MTIGPDGNVFIVDAGNNRVQLMNERREYVGQFGKKGFADGEFYFPLGVAVAGNYAYVADAANSRVHEFGCCPACSKEHNKQW